jgi:hypothetical protein
VSERIIKATVVAWLNSMTSKSPEQLWAEPTHVCGSVLSFGEPDLNMEGCGWTRVGTAEMTVTLVDDRQIIDNKVASLRAQLQKNRADAHMREQEILHNISKLLALEFDEASVVEVQP